MEVQRPSRTEALEMASVSPICSTLSSPDRWWIRPVAIFGTDLPPNLVLLAKLIAMGLVLQSQLPLSRTFVPFLEVFDMLGSPEMVRGTLIFIFGLGSVALLFTSRVRAPSLVLGLTILISMLAARATFKNNLTLCAALLIMIGLETQRGQGRMVRLQVAMLYFGAGLNKLLDPDWRSGQFFQYWFGSRHLWYLRIADSMPELLLSKLVSWSAISTELGLAVMTRIRRSYPILIWVGLTFHTSLLVLTNKTFGMFYFAACAQYLAFVTWPQDRMLVLYDGNCGLCQRIKNWFEHLDLERRFEWVPFQKAELSDPRIPKPLLSEKFYLIAGERQYCGFAAFRMLVLYNPLTYFALMAALRAPDVFHQRRWIALGALLLLSPIMTPVGQHIYRAASRNRYGFGKTVCAPQ